MLALGPALSQRSQNVWKDDTECVSSYRSCSGTVRLFFRLRILLRSKGVDFRSAEQSREPQRKSAAGAPPQWRSNRPSQVRIRAVARYQRHPFRVLDLADLCANDGHGATALRERTHRRAPFRCGRNRVLLSRRCRAARVLGRNEYMLWRAAGPQENIGGCAKASFKRYRFAMSGKTSRFSRQCRCARDPVPNA